MPKYEGPYKISFLSIPEVGEKRRKKRRKKWGGGTHFQPREFPRSGRKAEGVERKKKKESR